MTQVYGVLHDGKGRFFIATKRAKGYFFCAGEDKRGNPLPDRLVFGGADLNGKNLSALPGGRLDSTDADAMGGVVREFREETGIDLSAVKATVDDMKGPAGEWFTGFFNVSPSDFDALVKEIRTVILPAGDLAADKIARADSAIRVYDDVFKVCPDAPACNELTAGGS